jgi:2-hydroxychromene-2-carboxylate isomerase
MKTVRFLFDFVSPYSYLAWELLPTLAARHGYAVEPYPVLFAGLLNATGQKGPAEVPVERGYIIRDLMRVARAHALPFNVPASHPFNPLRPLRAVCATRDEAARARLVTAFFRAAWVEAREISDVEVARAICREAGVPEAADLAETPEAKELLRARTDWAIGRHVFGVPSMIVDAEEELFWGVESLPTLERYLQGHRDVDPALLERWRTLQPSARRGG